MVREKAWVEEPPPVTWTVKFDVPAAVGVPLITPVEAFRLNPAGRVPAETDQLYGVVPPVAVIVWLYAVPTVPAGSGLAVEIVGAATGLTVREKAFVAVPPPVTWTVKLKAPAVVGVPPITPVEAFRLSPAGSAPAEIDQLYGVVPPVAVIVWLYTVPTVAAGSGLTVEIVRAAAAATVKELVVTLCSPWVEPLSFAFPNQAAW
jgi:hypothetical protein